MDSIQLPLILLSILLAVYFYNKSKTNDNNVKSSARRLGEFIDKRNLLIILSGITLGLAIFTKIPALTMIPVVAYLIFRSDKKYSEKIKALGLWLIPVILIPAIWPVYAISVGEYDNWYDGVFSQAGREGSGIGSIEILFKIDPVLVSVGIIGLVFATIMKKDLFLLLWIVPFLAFHTVVPWTQHFHWLQVLPAFCIAGAVLIDGMANILGKKIPTFTYNILDDYTSNEINSITQEGGFKGIRRRLYSKYRKFVNSLSTTTLLTIMVTAFVIFGLLGTSMLITTNVNSSFFEMVTFVSKSLPVYRDVANDSNKKDENGGLCLWCTAPINRLDAGEESREAEETSEDNKVTIVGNHWIFGTFWIPKYVYDNDHSFKGFFTKGSVGTEKVLIVADSKLLDAISSENPEDHIRELQALYNNSTTVANFEERRQRFNSNIYPYQSMSENRGIGEIEIKANY